MISIIVLFFFLISSSHQIPEDKDVVNGLLENLRANATAFDKVFDGPGARVVNDNTAVYFNLTETTFSGHEKLEIMNVTNKIDPDERSEQFFLFTTFIKIPVPVVKGKLQYLVKDKIEIQETDFVSTGSSYVVETEIVLAKWNSSAGFASIIELSNHTEWRWMHQMQDSSFNTKVTCKDESVVKCTDLAKMLDKKVYPFIMDEYRLLTRLWRVLSNYWDEPRDGIIY